MSAPAMPVRVPTTTNLSALLLDEDDTTIEKCHDIRGDASSCTCSLSAEEEEEKNDDEISDIGFDLEETTSEQQLVRQNNCIASYV